jgi:hypothetical protein
VEPHRREVVGVDGGEWWGPTGSFKSDAGGYGPRVLRRAAEEAVLRQGSPRKKAALRRRPEQEGGGDAMSAATRLLHRRTRRPLGDRRGGEARSDSGFGPMAIETPTPLNTWRVWRQENAAPGTQSKHSAWQLSRRQAGLAQQIFQIKNKIRKPFFAREK